MSSKTKLLIVGSIIAFFVLIAATHEDKKQDCDDNNIKAIAETMFEQKLTSIALSPKSIEFGRQNIRISKTDKILVLIDGDVDASNAFGVMIRSHYRASYEFSGDCNEYDKWKCLKFEKD